MLMQGIFSLFLFEHSSYEASLKLKEAALVVYWLRYDCLSIQGRCYEKDEKQEVRVQVYMDGWMVCVVTALTE